MSQGPLAMPVARPLTTAEEVRLSRRIECGDRAAKDRMIESNLRLVWSVARAYRGLGASLDDLVQEGTIGLVRAIEKFDHRRGLKFSTYAVWWIRRGVVNAVRESRTIRMPARADRQLAALRQAEAELRTLGAGVATSEAIAARSGLSPAGVRALRSAPRVTASLDDEIGEDGLVLADLVADPEPADPWRQLEKQETQQQVSWMLQLLPKRHREVVVRRYGLDGRDPQTHTQIATRLHVGEERSRQLEREALHRLRELGGGGLGMAA